MKVAKVSELKASLSKYLARVKAGEEVLVTERGRPVAKLVPIPPAHNQEMERMQRLAKQGIVTLGTGRLPDDFWTRPRPKDPEGLLLKALLEERETGR